MHMRVEKGEGQTISYPMSSWKSSYANAIRNMVRFCWSFTTPKLFQGVVTWIELLCCWAVFSSTAVFLRATGQVLIILQDTLPKGSSMHVHMMLPPGVLEKPSQWPAWNCCNSTQMCKTTVISTCQILCRRSTDRPERNSSYSLCWDWPNFRYCQLHWLNSLTFLGRLTCPTAVHFYRTFWLFFLN
jgi:hypothetical protein